MPSVCEKILDRLHAVLLAADVGAVHRNRTDPLGADELPAIKIVRGQSDTSYHARGVDRTRFEFSLEHLVAGSAPETAADAQHVASYVALMSDDQLAALGADLRCTGTEPTPDEADIDVYRLTARYQIQFLTRPGDPTRNLS